MHQIYLRKNSKLSIDNGNMSLKSIVMFAQNQNAIAIKLLQEDSHLQNEKLI